MVENITVTDKNGNEIFAEGISYIQFLSSGKKYLLYTLNEPVANDRSKMYVAELTDNVGTLEKIPDEEWVNVRSALERLEHGELNPDVKFMSMANTSFKIGIPKKLAITAEMKQSFKDKQTAGVLANQQQQMVDAPAVTATSNGEFFNKEEVDQTPAFVSPDSMEQNQTNIFNNPMKPEVVPMQTVVEAPVQAGAQGIGIQNGIQMPASGVMQNPNAMNGQIMNNPQAVPAPAPSTPTPVPQVLAMPQAPQPELSQAVSYVGQNDANNSGLQNTGVNAAVMEEVDDIVDNAFITNPMPSISEDNTATDVASALETASLTDTGNSIQYQQGLATSLSNDLSIATGVVPKNDQKEVTKEEALEALEVLNRYFKNTKELPSALASELINQEKADNIVDVTNQEVYQQANDPVANLNNEINDSNNMPQSGAAIQEETALNVDGGVAQDQGRTLSLVPEGIPSIIPESMDANNNMMSDQSNQGNMYQFQTVENQNTMPMPGFDGQIVQPDTNQGYVASSSGAAVDMSSSTSAMTEVPVTLPDNYMTQASPNSNVVMGPGSLPSQDYVKVA
ncbi:MAG: hypothetical protein OSJ70_03055 [Bacilli bacterium]|nr:hypothetical protein [Bacilli bacterium]